MSFIVTEPVDLALHIGAGATAAALISSPVGIAGGVVFGVTSYLVGRPVEWVCTKVFNTDKPYASLISKVVGSVVGFFAGAGVCYGIMSALGISTTFGAVCALSLVSAGIGFVAITVIALAALAIGAVALLIVEASKSSSAFA